MRPAGVLFDLDGVLVDSHEVVERHWRAWAARRGADVDALLAFMPGVPSVDVIARFAPGIDAAADARALEEEQALDVTGLRAGPGAEALLAALAGAAVPWAVVTSGLRVMAEPRLAAVGLPVPEVFVTPDDVARGKPDPEPYLRAAELLGVPAPACAVLEDAPAGIAAGRAAGARVIAVATTFPAERLGEADVVIGSLSEAAGLLGLGA